MSNNAPYNLLQVVAVVYTATVGTAMPDVDEAPSGSWTKLGTSGEADYNDDGVTITTNQDFYSFIGSSTVERKTTRTKEEFMIELSLVDMVLESLRHAYNENSITTEAAGSGTPGRKSFNIYQGPDVATLAVCTRVYSPYSGDANSFLQFEQPNAFNAATGNSMVFRKDGTAAYKLAFKSQVDPANPNSATRMGKIRAYTAVAL